MYLGGYIHIQNDESPVLIVGGCEDDDGFGELDLIEIYTPSNAVFPLRYIVGCNETGDYPISLAGNLGPGYYWLHIYDRDAVDGNLFTLTLSGIEDTTLYLDVP